MGSGPVPATGGGGNRIRGPCLQALAPPPRLEIQVLAFLAFADAVPCLEGPSPPLLAGAGSSLETPLTPPPPPPAQEALPDSLPKGRADSPCQNFHLSAPQDAENENPKDRAGLPRACLQCRALREMPVGRAEKATVRCSPAQVTVTSAQTGDQAAEPRGHVASQTRPFKPLTSFLQCLGALAFPPPPGKPAHSAPRCCHPVLPSASSSQRRPPGLFASPQWVCITVDCLLTDSCPEAPFQGSSCKAVKFCLADMVFVLTAEP